MHTRRGLVSVVLSLAVLFSVAIWARVTTGVGAAEPAVRAELPDKRTEFSRTYRNPNGSLTTQISPEQINYKDLRGNLAPIDTTLKSDDSGFRVDANSLKVTLGSRPTDLVSLSSAKDPAATVTYGPLDADTSAMAPTKVGDESVTYRSYRAGADLAYEVGPGRLKEKIVLAAPPDDATFRFSLGLKGLKPRAQPDGSIALVDEKGAAQIQIEAPYMSDSSAGPGIMGEVHTSSEVTTTLLPQGAGDYVLVISADKGWLADPARKYPVVIDPTFSVATTSVADAYLNEYYPNNSYGNYTYMPAGSTHPSRRYRSLVRFDVSAIPGASDITTATLSLPAGSGSNINIDDYAGQTTTNLLRVTASWTETSATWANMAYNYSGVIATSSVDSPVYNVTNTVRDWQGGTYNNHGFMLSNSSVVKMADDAVPAEASQTPNPWTGWVTSPVHSGAKSHDEATATATHEHLFYGAPDFYVPSYSWMQGWAYRNSSVSEIMFQYRVGSSWEHRAYWGSNLINWGTDGTDSRRYRGALPSAGSWQQLLVPGDVVGLWGQYINGHSFTLYNGQAYFDEVANFRTQQFNTREAAVADDEKPTLSVTYNLPQLGDEDYKAYQEVGPVKVDLENGNLFYRHQDMGIEGRGIPTVISHTYNSLADTDSPYGESWSLEPLQRLATDTAGNVTINEGDGSAHIYQKSGTNFIHPAGVYKTLTKSAESTYSLYDIHEHVTWYFDAAGYLTSAIDSNGNSSTYTYTSGKLTKITDASSRETTLAYDGNGRLASITDPAGNQSTFSYVDGRLTDITNEEGESAHFMYITGTARLASVGGDVPDSVMISHATGVESVTHWTDPEGVWNFSYPDETEGGTGIKLKDIAVVSNPNSVETTYTLDTKANTLTVTDPIGASADPTTTEADFPNDEAVEASAIAAYDSYYATMVAQGKLTAQEQAVCTRTPTADGKDTIYYYDGNRNVIKQTDKDGLSTTSTYDENGNLLSETDRLGLVTDHEYDSNNNETKVTEPDGDFAQKEYDATTSQLLSETDAKGNETTYHYDQFGNCDWQVSARGNEAGADPDQFKSKFYYDAAGNYKTKDEGPVVHNSDGTTAQAAEIATYDTVGNKLTSTDATGNTTYFSYDDVGRFLTERQPTNVDGSATVTYLNTVKTYDEDGNLIKEESVDDTSGAVLTRTERAYDSGGQLTSEKVWSDVSSATAYSQTSYVYDECANKISETDPVGATTTHEYDALNRQIKQTNPDSSFVAFKYDAMGNEVKEGNNAGTSVKLYGQGGTQVASGDESGHTIKLITDAEDNQTARADAADKTTELGYDDNGNLTKVTEPTTTASETTGTQTVYEYDAADNNTLVEYGADDPDTSTETSVSYNEEDEELAESDQADELNENSYDPQMTLKTRSQANGTGFAVKYTAASTLATVTATGSDTTGSVDVSARYDVLGNVVYAETRDSQTGAIEATTAVSYDDASRPTAVTGALGVTTFLDYDKSGNVTEVTDSQGGVQASVGCDYEASRLATVTCADAQVVLDYDSVGRRSGIDALDGALSTDIDYSTASEVTSVVNRYDGQMRSSYAYGYDSKDNVTAATDASGTTSYSYDAKDRLVGVTNPDASTVTYAYDKVGNRLSKTVVSGASTATTNYVYNDANELIRTIAPDAAETDYLHDASGNLVSVIAGSTTTYAYDNNHRLVTATTPTCTVQFTYDAQGQRVKKAVTGEATYTVSYVHDGSGNVLLEVDDAGAVRVRYIRDDEGRALAMQQDGSTYYFLYNGRGDVTGLVDDAGEMVASYEYDEFGVTTEASGTIYNTLRFSGGNNAYFDSELGLYWIGARFYTPDCGRWTVRDSLAGSTYDPQTLQKYAYCKNNPVSFVDKDGHGYLYFNGKGIRARWNDGSLAAGPSWARTGNPVRGWRHKQTNGNNDGGPIPPGTYIAYNHEKQYLQYSRMLGVGFFRYARSGSVASYHPWGWGSWGSLRMPLHYDDGPYGRCGRTSLYLHGGRHSFTNGCIRVRSWFLSYVYNRFLPESWWWGGDGVMAVRAAYGRRPRGWGSRRGHGNWVVNYRGKAWPYRQGSRT